MSRRQDRPPKEKKPKPKAERPQAKQKKSPEELRREIRAAFRAEFAHEDE